MPNLEIVRNHRLAWAIVGVTVAGANAGAIVLGLLDRSVQSLTATVMFTVVTIPFALLGALIVSRRSGERDRLALHRRWRCSSRSPTTCCRTTPCTPWWWSPDSLNRREGRVVVRVERRSTACSCLFMSLLLLLFPTDDRSRRGGGGRWWLGRVRRRLQPCQGLHRLHHQPLSGVLRTRWRSQRHGEERARRHHGGRATSPTLIGVVAGVSPRWYCTSAGSVGVERQQVKWIVAGALVVAVVMIFSEVISACRGR